MTLPFDLYLSTLILRNYWNILFHGPLPMKSFIHSLAIVIAAIFIFGCPPKHEEPISGNLSVTSRSEHLVMGNPRGAVDSVSYSNNYLMEKPQYVVSYNRGRGISNWVTWNSDNMWPGSVPQNNTGTVSNPTLLFNLSFPV